MVSLALLAVLTVAAVSFDLRFARRASRLVGPWPTWLVFVVFWRWPTAALAVVFWLGLLVGHVWRPS